MNWQKSMDQALQYIEDNLESRIDYKYLAQCMKCSEGEFRRMFSFLSDIPLSDYIRNRKLTVAASDIVDGTSLLDVANKYGYESQASFSRAFKNFHGCPPSKANRHKDKLNVCSRLTLKLVVMDGKTVMQSSKNRVNIIGSRNEQTAVSVELDPRVIHEMNDLFWTCEGNDMLGTTALPHYGAFTSEEKHQLLGDLRGKRLLEIGCGSGQSLLYVGQKGARELWGIDISKSQIKKTHDLLTSKKLSANLYCSTMEEACGIPTNYFDIVYSVYGIGWTTDLEGTFKLIKSYLKPGGVFIFSWSHPIHKCVSMDNEGLQFKKCYFDESQYTVSMGQTKLSLCDRKMSTYINALAKAGFIIEEMIEESDSDMTSSRKTDFSEKAKMLPVTFVIKAKKVHFI